MSAEELKSVAQRRDTRLLMWLIVALGTFLRLRGLQAKSFWLDEIASVVIARMPGNSFWHWLWTEEGNMALYYVMLRPWLEIHLGEATVRVLSALPGIASIPAMYLLGRKLFGRNAGLLSALLLAVSTCAVVYSQEARGYSWLLLGTIASTYFFARLIGRPTFAMACAYALAAGVTFYFHYFGLLVPLGHAVSLEGLPRARRPWKQLCAAGPLMALFAAPVLWMIHTQPGRHLDWVSKPSLLEVYHLGVFLAAESGKGVGPVLLVLELALVVGFCRAMLAARRAPAQPEFFSYALVASALLMPIAFSLLVSVVRPVFFHRFLIICLPAWLLAVSVGTLALTQTRWRTAAIAGVCGLSLVSTALSYSRMREDWRGAVNYLIDNGRAQDVVLYYQPVGHWAAESYRDWLPGGSANRPTPVSAEPQSNEWRTKIAGARRVWLVEYPANMSDETSRAVEMELHRRYTAVESRPFRAITVTEFVQKP
ncbi:MAG TPA: glycosyltransferase family 39 protein [Candidatus Angelobacter sp.]|nr:glycosyltransferase family 39 protein [Candidatus Angelobacter sp.]